MSDGSSSTSRCSGRPSLIKVFVWNCSISLAEMQRTFGSGAYRKQRNENSTITNSDGSDGKGTPMLLNEVILTAGQLALALCGIASCMALVCIIFAMLRWIVRTVRAMGSLDRPPDRPTVGGGLRKW